MQEHLSSTHSLRQVKQKLQHCYEKQHVRSSLLAQHSILKSAEAMSVRYRVLRKSVLAGLGGAQLKSCPAGAEAGRSL